MIAPQKERADPSPEAAAHARRMLDSTPMGHRGSPQDIAHGALHLASEEADFVTGTELVVDGDYTAVRAVTPRSCLRAPTTGCTAGRTVNRPPGGTRADRPPRRP
ncbi:SDR family oxidoreductase [Streptomyces sp. NPDC057565]|uniref:SDR family oxidoreductase n=1 Tax=Streptomyces sp. NPDC057565 TaxID=3346169 RepID=UPI0036BB6CD3